MNENRTRPDADKNEKTRSIPIQKNNAGVPMDGTRQIPIKRNPTPKRDGVSAENQRMTKSNGATRAIPIRSNGGSSGSPGTAIRKDSLERDNIANEAGKTRQISVNPQSNQSNRNSASRISGAPGEKSGTVHAAHTDTQRKVVNQNGRTGSSSDGALRRSANFAASNSAEIAAEFGKTKEVRTNSQIRGSAGSGGDINNTESGKASGSAASQKLIKSRRGNAEPKESKDKKNKDNAKEIGGSAIASIIKAVVYIVSVLVISIAASVFIILVGNDVFAFVKSDEVIEVTVPEGANVDDIAALLSNNGVINYPGIFKFYADYKNDDGKFVAGQYSISPNMDYDDLLDAFKEQVPEGTTWITIPEGYTTDEIIDLFVENGIGTKDGYINVINNYAFDYWFVQELDKTDWKSSGRYYRLDGYLFPDTYEFYSDSSERTVISKLLSKFNVIYGDKYKEAADSMNLSTDQVITIASMIEKEAGNASYYHRVSSVFHNRLNSEYYPKLESDATILYAIHHDTGERPSMTTFADLEYDSPYNTYLYDGLPPGPIANPSASAINAALTPENTNYYYFLSYGNNTLFASTYDEHEAHKAMREEYRTQMQANG